MAGENRPCEEIELDLMSTGKKSSLAKTGKLNDTQCNRRLYSKWHIFAFLGGKDFAVVHDLLDTLLYELHFEMVIDLRDALMHVVCRFILSVLMDVVFSYLTQ